jgi:hypothetical protein
VKDLLKKKMFLFPFDICLSKNPGPHRHKTFLVFSREFSTQISEDGGAESILSRENITYMLRMLSAHPFQT